MEDTKAETLDSATMEGKCRSSFKGKPTESNLTEQNYN
jgi:hypothetical protein